MKRIFHVANAFERFVKGQSFGGILLVLCTLVALIWANGPYAHSYFGINHAEAGFKIGSFQLFKSSQHWINDGLMAVFFLLVGLEIKREVLSGELSAFNKALLPIIAAIGGIVMPAGIFMLINHQSFEHFPGWAIPTATDIAFALGIMSLLGKRVPRNLILLLAAIAIVDDLVAVLIIAIFYTKHVVMHDLLICLFCFVLLAILAFFKTRRLLPYIFVGIVMWYFMLQSGVHATIAGILLAILIPSRTGKYDPTGFSNRMHMLIDLFDKTKKSETEKQLLENRKAVLATAGDLIQHEITPLQRLENILHAPVNYFIIPLFVFFNAGVALSGNDIVQAFSSTLTIGIILGLVVGKCIGIFGFTAIASFFKLVKLPKGIGLRHVFPLSLIAGVGFTMSIFIGDLAFSGAPSHMTFVKIGILAGSLISAVVGFVILRMVCPKS